MRNYNHWQIAIVKETEIDELVRENRRRYEEIYGTYDPQTAQLP